MSESDLSQLRSEVDEIDSQIVDLLAQRFTVTDRIGKLKARSGMPAADRSREAQQVARYRELAAAAKLDSELVVGVFRMIIDEVVKNHAAA